MGKKNLSGPAVLLKGLTAVLAVLTLATACWAAGSSAPDFTLPSVLDGKQYSLSQYRGKVVLVNFFTFFCGPCREEMPQLNQIYKENQGRGYVTLGIGLASNPTQLRFLVKQLGLDYPVLVGDDKVAKEYGNVEVVPTTFIIDRSGNIVQKIVGSRSKDDFLKMIRPLL
jgi:cytochrome c biogenesis protein CcmG/thiol:disulfide interchange protein DsbE|uniref:TlpA family protein disulfide reductase n=1 Tax=Desulfobacca acetoxidans TaxID=60893 RepID=A0A7V6A4X3_9BACT